MQTYSSPPCICGNVQNEKFIAQFIYFSPFQCELILLVFMLSYIQQSNLGLEHLTQ